MPCLLDLFRDNFCPIHSFVVDRSKTSEAELFFNERLQRAEDYDFLLRLCAKYKSDFSVIDTVVGDYYFKDDGSNTTELTATTEDRSAPWRYAVEYSNLQKRFLTLSRAVEESLGLEKSDSTRKIADLFGDLTEIPKPVVKGRNDSLREFVPAGHFYSPVPSGDDVSSLSNLPRAMPQSIRSNAPCRRRSGRSNNLHPSSTTSIRRKSRARPRSTITQMISLAWKMPVFFRRR